MEKLINSGFYRFCEKLYVLIILNFISFVLIVLGLGVVTTLPVLVSLVLVLKDYKSNESFPFVKVFFKCFKDNFKKTFKLSLPYTGLICLFIFNTYYFYSWTNESSALYYSLSYYFCLFVDVLILLSFINCAFIYVYFPYLTYKKMLKYSLVLLKVLVLKMIIMLLLLVGFLYLAVLFVPFLPTILISLYIFIMNIMVSNTYSRIIAKDEKPMSAYNYV